LNQITYLLLKKWGTNLGLKFSTLQHGDLLPVFFLGVNPPGNREDRPGCFEKVNGSGGENISFPQKKGPFAKIFARVNPP